MSYLLLTAALLCVSVGHIFKTMRWALYISVYELADKKLLLKTLSLAQTVNAILPIRLGDLIRILLVGKKLQNGYSLSIATVITDLVVDLITVSLILFALIPFSYENTLLIHLSKIYILLLISVFIGAFILVKYRVLTKKLIAKISSIFNEKIEFSLLYVSYLTISSFKDLLHNINKLKFSAYTLLMWFFYLFAYYLFSKSLQIIDIYYSFTDIFVMLFSGINVISSSNEIIIYWSLFLLLPLLFCFIISELFFNKRELSKRYRIVLPQMTKSDKLAYLQTYYSSENREHLQSYLDINSDVTIVEDKSAGSNASTVIALKNGKLYYRKYAFDDDGLKLKEQIKWIESNCNLIPLPAIIEKKFSANFTCYDMPDYPSSMNMFRYIHTRPVENAWGIIKRALDDLRLNLHAKSYNKSSKNAIRKYLQDKLFNNILKIQKSSKVISSLEQYKFLIVNGINLPTLSFYNNFLTMDEFSKILSEDKCSEIHGDFTIENIVCLMDGGQIDTSDYYNKIIPNDYYFIDPNTGNIHNSTYLDYSKLLQSLHGNYEFLMMVKDVDISKNNVIYTTMESDAYVKLYEKYKNYLKEFFTPKQIKSIYYHEIIHWLRLLPYKINQNEKLSVVFYTGLLKVINDVWNKKYEE